MRGILRTGNPLIKCGVRDPIMGVCGASSLGVLSVGFTQTVGGFLALINP
jgi:hypothetical protein